MSEQAPRCPLRMKDDDRAGCCTWGDFVESFLYCWPRWFDAPPTLDHWKSARRDWKAGNTGYEAAHNAQRRAKEKVLREQSKPLVWLGGRNYAEEGSALAIKYGKQRATNTEGEKG